MILKVNDNGDFNLSMSLHINYDLEYVEFDVTLHNKRKHTAQLKRFSASEFSEVLHYYKQQEDMFL